MSVKCKWMNKPYRTLEAGGKARGTALLKAVEPFFWFQPPPISSHTGLPPHIFCPGQMEIMSLWKIAWPDERRQQHHACARRGFGTMLEPRLRTEGRPKPGERPNLRMTLLFAFRS